MDNVLQRFCSEYFAKCNTGKTARLESLSWFEWKRSVGIEFERETEAQDVRRNQGSIVTGLQAAFYCFPLIESSSKTIDRQSESERKD